MFKNFFDRFKTVRLDDPFFGRIEQMLGGRRTPACWSAERAFSPIGETIEVFFDTPSWETVSSQAQRDFFLRVERDYDAICAIVEQAFREDEWARELLTGKPFRKAFIPSSLSIPDCEGPDEEWEFTFFPTKDDEPHHFTATFQGMRVTNVSADG